VRLVLTAEQEELRATVRRLLSEHAPMTRVREVAVDGHDYDRGLWARLAELGVTALTVDEKHGGADAGNVELCVVAEELGRALAPVPFVSAAIAAAALTAAGDAAADDLLAKIADGSAVAAVATADTADGLPAARRDGDTWTLDGTANLVLDGQFADHIIVVADDAVLLVDAAAAGLTRTALTSADPTRAVARLDFAGTTATALAAADPGAVRAAAARTAALVLAAEQAGGAAACLEATVDYAKIRLQFGRVIGSFQAVKHALADMYSESEQASAALRYAAWAADEDEDAADVAASLAKVACSEAYAHVTAQMIQIHGGIGFTWEHDAHLYFKRARSSSALFGDPAHHRELLAQRLGL
jgi:alkylation response protein AidB-like acyl-CoA dehydrogenase